MPRRGGLDSTLVPAEVADIPDMFDVFDIGLSVERMDGRRMMAEDINQKQDGMMSALGVGVWRKDKKRRETDEKGISLYTSDMQKP